MSRIRNIPSTEWRKDREAWGGAKCNLYVIQEGAGGNIKVGIAGHPVRRLLSLQCGNPRRLYLRAVYAGDPAATRFAERFALRSFKSRREWLKADLGEVIKLLDLIAGHDST